jgi:DNA modification methylase
MNISMGIKRNCIHQGNAIDLLEDEDLFPDDSVDMWVTSPPYWNQRFYGNYERIFDAAEGCKHEWVLIDVLRKPTPGDKPGKNSSVAGNYLDHYSTIRPGRPSYICKDCGAWKGNFGLEPNPYMYIRHLCDVFDAAKRSMKNALWVNIGDKYNDSGGAGGMYSKYRKKNKHTQFGKIVEGEGCSLPTHIKWMPRKTLFGLPHLFVVEMLSRKWILRNVLIWRKPAPTPFSGKDRFTIDFEYFFFFVKNPKYYFNQQLEPLKDKYLKRETCYGGITKGVEGYSNPTYRGRAEYDATTLKGKNKRTTWDVGGEKVLVDASYLAWLEAGKPETFEYNGSFLNINTASIGVKHYAVYPIKLLKTPILASSEKNGIVGDMFMGSGSTAIASNRLNRDWVGCEINPEYIKIAIDRISTSQKKRNFRKSQVNLRSLKK